MTLVDVENLVEKVCQTIGIQEDAFGNVLIAVTEAVNNAISHGNEQDSTRSIDVMVGNSTESFCFKIKDQGLGFDYDNLPDPTAPENILKENGRGIFLMRNLSDEVSFNETGNEVIIYFSK
jgi:serine/threonine-protein kinase RsbW